MESANLSENLVVSIIIPAFNAEKLLDETLDSIAKQTYKDFEVILVNDGSTDNTEAVALAYSDKLRMSYIYQDNQGLSAARNTGIRKASGSYICFVDADDILPETAISDLVSAIINLDESYAAVYGKMQRFDHETSKPINILDFSKVSFTPIKLLNTRANLLLACLFREDAIKRAGFFDTKLISASEDIDYMFKVSQVGKLKGIEKITYKYRVLATSKSRNRSPKYIESVAKERKMIFQRSLEKEALWTKLYTWSNHYTWLGVDYNGIDKAKARISWAKSVLINPFNITSLKLLRASLLGKI